MITKMTLVSENCSFGVLPEYDTEVEQRLTIRSDGRVWLSRYAITPHGKNYRTVTERYSADPRHVAELFSIVSKYFLQEHDSCFATDIGFWNIQLFTDDNQIYKECGSMCGLTNVNGDNLSGLLRKLIPTTNLFAFGG